MIKVVGVFLNADRIVEIDAGETIFGEGDVGEEMYGVISGSVQLMRDGNVLRRLESDDVFGEFSLVDASPRSATAVAAEDTVLAVIDRKTFLFLVHETPMFALHVMSSMAELLRHQS